MAGGPKASNGGGAAEAQASRINKKPEEAPQEEGETRGRGQRARTSASTRHHHRPKKENVVVEYVSAAYDADAAASLFKDVFAKFASAEELTTDQVEEAAAETPAEQKADDVDEDEAPEKRLSRKQRKAMSRMTVAELKQVVARPGGRRGARRHGLGSSLAGLPEVLPEHGARARGTGATSASFYRGNGAWKKNRSSCPSTSPRPVCIPALFSCAPRQSTRRAFRSCVCAMAWRFPRHRRDVGPVAASARGRGG